MTEPVLVTYASRYGATCEVAEAIASSLRAEDLQVEAAPMDEVRSLRPYGAVVLGAALYLHRWPGTARRFLARHRRKLVERPVAVFALGPVKDPHDDEEWRASREQLDRELARHGWLEPLAVELFGGRFDPALLRFPLDRFAGSEPATDIRDWDAIRAWARTLPAGLRAAASDAGGPGTAPAGRHARPRAARMRREGPAG